MYLILDSCVNEWIYSNNPSWKEKGNRIISKVGANSGPHKHLSQEDREHPTVSLRRQMCGVPVACVCWSPEKWNEIHLRMMQYPLCSMKRMYTQHTHVWTRTRNTLTQTHTPVRWCICYSVWYIVFMHPLSLLVHTIRHTHKHTHTHTQAHAHTRTHIHTLASTFTLCTSQVIITHTMLADSIAD